MNPPFGLNPIQVPLNKIPASSISAQSSLDPIPDRQGNEIESSSPRPQLQKRSCLLCRERKKKCYGSPECRHCVKNGYLCAWPPNATEAESEMEGVFYFILGSPQEFHCTRNQSPVQNSKIQIYGVAGRVLGSR